MLVSQKPIVLKYVVDGPKVWHNQLSNQKIIHYSWAGAACAITPIWYVQYCKLYTRYME